MNKPAVLAENESAWTQCLTEKLSSGEKPTDAEKTRYRHPQIKAALVQETHGKCAYCESKLQHIHHGDVEHIFPKSLAPEKTFVWENLTLACELCNQNKSNNDPLLTYIIDPYNTDPSNHMVFLGALVFSLGTAAGINTRALLDLDRADLVEQRKSQLEKIMGIFDTLLRPDIPLVAKKAIYKDLLKNETSASAPYAAMATAVVEAMKEKLAPALLAP